MAATHKLIGLNIVLVSGNINTSAFSQYWFIKKEIFTDEEFLTDSMFIPGLSNVSTNDCQITSLPDKIQPALKSDSLEDGERCVKEKFCKFIDAMENVSINAIGLNFLWRVEDAAISINQFGKELFWKDNAIGNYFTEDNARYGAYYSKNYDDLTRLKLDIKPIHSKENGNMVEYQLASFNYHSDVNPEHMKEHLKGQLAKWPALLNNSQEVVCLLK